MCSGALGEPAAPRARLDHRVLVAGSIPSGPRAKRRRALANRRAGRFCRHSPVGQVSEYPAGGRKSKRRNAWTRILLGLIPPPPLFTRCSFGPLASRIVEGSRERCDDFGRWRRGPRGACRWRAGSSAPLAQVCPCLIVPDRVRPSLAPMGCLEYRQGIVMKLCLPAKREKPLHQGRHHRALLWLRHGACPREPCSARKTALERPPCLH